MRHLGRDIDVITPRGDGIEVVGEAVPVPGQAFAQHDLGDVFHALHQVDQHVVLVLAARRESNAAVAEQHGGGPVPRRGRQPIAPGDLRVVVRVHVDETRRDHQPGECRRDAGAPSGQLLSAVWLLPEAGLMSMP